tara:strand:+ start:248 stop:718 length:471 start_codon:yes stop_codon:yes gene_type:complete
MAINFPEGTIDLPTKVLQVKFPDTNDVNSRTTTTSSSFVDTGVHIDITPKSATSYILLIASTSIHNSAGNQYCYHRWKRTVGSSVSYVGPTTALHGGLWLMMPQVTGISSVDNTTNHEFKLQHKTSGGGTNYIGWSQSGYGGTFNFNYICALEVVI